MLAYSLSSIGFPGGDYQTGGGSEMARLKLGIFSVSQMADSLKVSEFKMLRRVAA